MTFAPPIAENDALPLEYKLQYGCAIRDLDVSDVVNDPVVAGVCSILSLRFKEQAVDIFSAEVCSLANNIPDTLLVS